MSEEPTPSRWVIPTSIPRHAFSARDVARAGDVWRAFQEVAVEASSRAGYPPDRYREERIAFVMRSMTVVHDLEARYGQGFTGTTWVRRFRREMLSTREVALWTGPETDEGHRDLRVARGTQEWVHVDSSLSPVRASASALAAFPIHDEDQGVALESVTQEMQAPEDSFEFAAWFTAMDPLDHANHPAYVDYCDEAIARRVHAAGLAPIDVQAHAEKVLFMRGLVAPESASVTTRLVGCTAHAAVFEHVIAAGEAVCAKATTHRSLRGDAAALARVFTD